MALHAGNHVIENMALHAGNHVISDALKSAPSKARRNPEPQRYIHQIGSFSAPSVLGSMIRVSTLWVVP